MLGVGVLLTAGDTAENETVEGLFVLIVILRILEVIADSIPLVSSPRTFPMQEDQ